MPSSPEKPASRKATAKKAAPKPKPANTTGRNKAYSSKTPAQRASVWGKPFNYLDERGDFEYEGPGFKAAPKPSKKAAPKIGKVYLADGTEYKGKNGKPSGSGTVAPKKAAPRKTAPRKAGPPAKALIGISKSMKKPIPRATRSSKRR